MSKMSKGQISTLDLVMAAFVFILIFLTVMWSWNDTGLRIDRFEDRRGIYQKGLDVGEALVKTSGEPANWHSLNVANSSTVNSLGLASQDNVLDQAKIDRFGGMEYEEVRGILGLSREDFNLTIYNSTGGLGDALHSFGQPSLNLTKVRVSRYASLGDDVVELRLILFYNTSTHIIT